MEDQANDYIWMLNNSNQTALTSEEVKDALQQVKTNKAAGKDGIGVDHIKMGPKKLVACLHRLTVSIWKTD